MDAWQVYSDCARLAWAPGLGDSDGLGVILTALYAAATVLVAAVALRGPLVSAEPRRERWLWGLAAGALLLLAVNKQLDLQSFVTGTARCLAREQGWYDLRRSYQREAVLILIGIAAAGSVASLLLFRRTLGGSRLLLIGLAGLVTFVLIRAVSFHHMDQFLGRRLLSIRLHRLIETGSLVVVILAALRRLGRRPG